MAQPAIFPAKGKILYKNIAPSVFAVTYQCSCGSLVEFRLEEKKTCGACHAIYQLRVMVGKVSKQ
jgi:hypothetical protein